MLHTFLAALSDNSPGGVAVANLAALSLGITFAVPFIGALHFLHRRGWL